MSSHEAQNADENEKMLKARIQEMEEEVLNLKKSLAKASIGDSVDAGKDQKESSQDSSEYGYVYILQADLRSLCCDYWFGASGGVLEPSRTDDFPHSSTTEVEVKGVPGDKDMDDIWKMCTYEPWPADIPKPYTVRVPHKSKSKTSEYVSQVGRYLRAAAQEAYHPSRQPFRSTFRNAVCPLMATPLIGTGWGGNQRNTGEMALHLLPTLYHLANELRIDVALVTNDKEVYALMQWARRNMLANYNSGGDMSPHHPAISGDRFLLPTTSQRIEELSQHAIRGQLSLFIGAGASMGSNVPDWRGLLESLAKELGLTGERRKEFSEVDLYTKAAVLEAEVERRQREEENLRASSTVERRHGGNNHRGTSSASGRKAHRDLCLGDYVAANLIHARYSVVHALLASLPVQEAITTNYDDLFEKAWTLHGDFAVLPHAPMRSRNSRRGGKEASSKWLLKMHGCVTTPEEIVLTKSHYIRYAERYAALAGIVQGSLLTRHLLFVGFSFDDDNFQRIFDPVRKAKRHQQQRLKERKESLSTSSLSTFHGGSSSKKRSDEKYKSFLKFSSEGNSGNDKRSHSSREAEAARANARWGVTRSDSDDSDDGDCCGTALLLQHSVLKEELWDGDICMTAMGPSAPPLPGTSIDQHMSSLARKQEIFLDILSSHCAVSLQMEFLMNDKFEKALSPPELQLRNAVREFEGHLRRLPFESTQNVAFSRITDMLKSLGSDCGRFY